MTILPGLIMSAWLTLAWVPSGAIQPYDPPRFLEIDLANSWYSEVGVYLNWGPCFFGGSMRVPMWGTGFISFFPNQLQSTVGAGVDLGPLRIGYRHTCTHAVIPAAGKLSWCGEAVVPGWDGKSDTFYATLHVGEGR